MFLTATINSSIPGFNINRMLISLRGWIGLRRLTRKLCFLRSRLLIPQSLPPPLHKLEKNGSRAHYTPKTGKGGQKNRQNCLDAELQINAKGDITDLVPFYAKPFYGTLLVSQGEFTFATAFHLKRVHILPEFNQAYPADSVFLRFECAIGDTGNDDVLFILGLKIFVTESCLSIEGFSCLPGEHPRASIAARSMSDVVFRNLKLNLGMKLFTDDDLPLDDESGDPSSLP
nr:hypothetical protein Iba_chr12bCG8290 [Ipomoea batatas]